MAAAAKQERENAIRDLRTRCGAYRTLIDAAINFNAGDPPINYRKLQAQLEKLKLDYQTFDRKHNAYRAIAKLENTPGQDLENDNELWHNWYKIYDDLTDDAAELLDSSQPTPTTLTQQQKIAMARNDV